MLSLQCSEETTLRTLSYLGEAKMVGNWDIIDHCPRRLHRGASEDIGDQVWKLPEWLISAGLLFFVLKRLGGGAGGRTEI